HSYDIEYRVRRRDGEYRWFKTRGVPIRDTGGNIVKWFGTCTDITELRQSEGRFRGIFENAAVGIAQTHPSGRFLRVNEKFCSIVGYAREELVQKSFQDITHPDDVSMGVSALAALLRGQSPSIEHEKRYIRKDGSPVWGELFISLQRDAAGEPAYAIAVIQDISERKRLELSSQVQPDVPDALVGDAARMRQVLLNLVGNAVKFTDEGEVVVTVEIADCRLQIEDLKTPPEFTSSNNLQSEICNLKFTV